MGFNSGFKGLINTYRRFGEESQFVSLKYDSICQTQLIYVLIIIRLAACFDLAGSLSGLHYEPFDIRKLRTFLGSQTVFTKVNMKGSCPMAYNMLTSYIRLKLIDWKYIYFLNHIVSDYAGPSGRAV